MLAPHALDQNALALLSALLAQSPQSDAGVDPFAFRAAHYEHISVIDRMESAGYIRKEQERYHVSLTALVQMPDERAVEILRDSEKLFALLKLQYRQAQRQPLNVVELAAYAGLDPMRAKEALSYMVEASSWWGGRSRSFYSDPEPSITPGEAVLGYASFAEVIAQLRGWQSSRIRDRQAALDTGLRPTFHPVAESANQQTPRARQPPDWIGDLPPKVKELASEIYSALSLNLRALPAMGVRAVIDMVFVELVGDVGSFEEKLRQLVKEGQLSERDRSSLAAAIEAGSASAHRGHVPQPEDLGVLLDIVERLLHGQYVLPKAAQQVKANTPARSPRSAKKTE